MIATIDGHMVQGTPEEIGRLLGFTIKSSNSNYTATTYIPSGNCPPGYDPNLCGDTDCRKCIEQWMKGNRQSTADVVKRRSCDTCQHYEGVHYAHGHAPCSFWKIGCVMWNDFCSRWEKENGELK